MARPFLKWAGGKGQLLPVIEKNLPEYIDTYIEPFVGSGAVMFDILKRKPDVRHVIINDINTDLINTYTVIRDYVEDLILILHNLQREYVESAEEERNTMYQAIRNEYNERLAGDIRMAALFIFLNRTCFNGLYRVNSKNFFNVPHGRYANPKICDEVNLRAVSDTLRIVEIYNLDYADLAPLAREGSFVYLDPPYKPISNTSTFNSYSAEKFDDQEQIRLRDFCNTISGQGSSFMLSNSDPRSINPQNCFFDEIYQEYYIKRVQAKRNINANGNGRGEINELLITNYDNHDALLLV